MKRFEWTPERKKWALTATLVAVLGFNLSLPQHGETLDFASNSEFTTVEYEAKDGAMYKIKVLKTGDKNVTAMVPYALEGRNCDTGTCLSAQVLDVPFEDLKKVSDALGKNIEETRKTTVGAKANEVAAAASGTETAEETPVAKTADELKDERNTKIRENNEKALEKLLAKCERKSESNMLPCLLSDSDGFMSILKKNAKISEKDQRLSPEVAAAFFNDNIRPELEGMISAGQYGYQKAAILIRNIQARLPRFYADVRAEIKNMSVEMVRAEVVKYNNMVNEANVQTEKAAALQAQIPVLQEEFNAAMASGNMGMAKLAQSKLNRAMVNLNTAQQIADARTAQSDVQLNFAQNFLTTALQDQQLVGLNYAVSTKLIDQSTVDTYLTDLRTSISSLLDNPSAVSPSITTTTGTTTSSPTVSVDSNGTVMIKDVQGQGTITGGGSQFGPIRQFNNSLVNGN